MPGEVRFIYIPEGHELPPSEERDFNALYFVAAAQQIFRGPMLMADHIDVEAFLEPYKIKNIEIVGDGDYISSISFNQVQGLITATKSDLQTVIRYVISQDPTIAKITDIPRWDVVTD